METVQEITKQALKQALRARYNKEAVIFSDIETYRGKTTLSKPQFYQELINEATTQFSAFDLEDREMRTEVEVKYNEFETSLINEVLTRLEIKKETALSSDYRQWLISQIDKKKLKEKYNETIEGEIKERLYYKCIDEDDEINDISHYINPSTVTCGIRIELSPDASTEKSSNIINNIKEIDGYLPSEITHEIEAILNSSGIVNINEVCPYLSKRYTKHSLLYIVRLLNVAIHVDTPHAAPTLPQLKTKLTEPQRWQLFDELIKRDCIAKDTDRESFLWVFGSSVPPTNYKPLKWIKTDALLVYLIYELCNDPAGVNNHWSVAQPIFEVKNMAQIKNGYESNKTDKPRGANQIDEIIRKVKESE